MPGEPINFREQSFRKKPIRDLQLAIEGTRIEPLVKTFEQELLAVGLTRLRPRFYLSTEWGVPFGTIAIGIPFYLAHPDLIAVHAQEVGHIEGYSDTDILKYIRHEMGHVVNYAYKLYEREDWIDMFGSITQPYLEEYRPEPFSTRYVQHLPGWYAQKHPDEDWSETFAVWMTPGAGWHDAYVNWEEALEKLQFCDQLMRRLGDTDPPVTQVDLDEDVKDLTYSVDEYYVDLASTTVAIPAGLDSALKAMFEDFGQPEISAAAVPRINASTLMQKLERSLMANVFRWTGHFPEQTRLLLRHFEKRADELKQVYPEDREAEVTVALTTLVTSLATTYVHRGTYLA